jgi:hypothetical protein
VPYVVESAHPIVSGLMVVIVDQSYTDRVGEPRVERAKAYPHLCRLVPGEAARIVAGQNTVRTGV